MDLEHPFLLFDGDGAMLLVVSRYRNWTFSTLVNHIACNAL